MEEKKETETDIEDENKKQDPDKLQEVSDSSKKDDENLDVENDEQPSYEPPKPVERVIKHPKTDVVKSPDTELDMDWGWAIEFTSSDSLEPVWNKLKEFIENSKNEHPIAGTAKWLSLDPRGYFSPRLRHFITITGWGFQVEAIQEWFIKNISEIKKPAKIVESSEELAENNWEGYIVKESIEFKGSKFITIDNYSRNKRILKIESKKPVPGTITRYWAKSPLFSSRDYLIPFVTKEKYDSGVKTPESYLEEYIVEQLDWIETENNKDEFIVLPEQFKSEDDSIRGIDIPEEYTPEIDFSGMGGMFPGMGGMGGMPDFDMDALKNMKLDDEGSEEDKKESDSEESDVIDAEIIEEK